MSSKRKTSPAPAEVIVAPAPVVEEHKKKHKKAKAPEEVEVVAPAPVVEEQDPPKKKKKAVAGEPVAVAPPSPNPKKAPAAPVAADPKKKAGNAAAAAAAMAAAAPMPVAPAAAPAKQSQVVLITQPRAPVAPKVPGPPPAAAPINISPIMIADAKKPKPVAAPAPAVLPASAATNLAMQGMHPLPNNPALMAALGIPSGAALSLGSGFLPQFFLASGADFNGQIKKRKRPEVNPQEMFTDTLNAFTSAMTQLAALLPRSYSNTAAMNDMAKVYDNAINTLHAQRQKLSTKPPKVKVDEKGNLEEDDSRGHRWTDEDTIKMMEMKTNGQTNRAVALALGRSTAAVSQRYKLVKAGKVACPGFDPVAAKAKAAATAAVAAITGPPLKSTGAAADDDEEEETDEEDEDEEDEEEHSSHLSNIVAARFGPLGGAKGKAEDDE